jgi:hypothetical protein
MKPRYRGSVSAYRTKGKVQQGRGKVTVIVTKKGIYFSNKSFKAMGLKMNAAKMKRAAPVKKMRK